MISSSVMMSWKPASAKSGLQKTSLHAELAGAQHSRSRQTERAVRSHAAKQETHLENDHGGGYEGFGRKSEE